MRLIRSPSASPVALTVVPVLAEGDTTLNDIRPQAGLDLPANWTVLIAGLVLATAFAGGGLWLYRRRRGNGSSDGDDEGAQGEGEGRLVDSVNPPLKGIAESPLESVEATDL